MNDDPTSPYPPEVPPNQDTTDYDNLSRAVHLLEEIITLLAAQSRSQIGHKAQELHNEELRYAQERQRLSIENKTEVARILTDYPARLRELRQG